MAPLPERVAGPRLFITICDGTASLTLGCTMMANSSWSSVGMSIIFRPPRANELQPAQELVVCSINDLTERHGFGPMATLRPTEFQFFPDELWVAEADGEIVGFALIWVCGDLWFLAELFVAPGYQGGGVGNELLARTFEHARKAGPHDKKAYHVHI